MEPRTEAPDLQASRRAAVEHSMGISEDAIYTAVERRLKVPLSTTWPSIFGRGARGLRFSDDVVVTARKAA